MYCDPFSRRRNLAMNSHNPQNISLYYQTKISLVSSYLAVLVLYVHGYFYVPERFPFSHIIISIIERFSYRAINPTYFAISGFLFFFGVKTITDCYPKLRKRIHTVLVPFILWNIIAIIEQLIFSKLPYTRDFLNRDILSYFLKPSGIYDFFIGPASFHLWFLRDLFIYFLLSPLIYWIVKRFRWYVTPIMLVLTPPLMHWQNLNHLDIAFFILGATIAIHSNLESTRRFLSKPLVILSTFGYLGLSAFWDLIVPVQFKNEGYLTLVFSICGMITVWRGYDWLAHKMNIEHSRLLLSLTNYTFFIYLFHEPILFIFTLLGKRLFGGNDFSLIFIYLANPILIIILGVFFAKGIKAISPTLYAILVGGRVTRFKPQVKPFDQSQI